MITTVVAKHIKEAWLNFRGVFTLNHEIQAPEELTEVLDSIYNYSDMGNPANDQANLRTDMINCSKDTQKAFEDYKITKSEGYNMAS